MPVSIVPFVDVVDENAYTEPLGTSTPAVTIPNCPLLCPLYIDTKLPGPRVMLAPLAVTPISVPLGTDIILVPVVPLCAKVSTD
jgi:hypothetical protein